MESAILKDSSSYVASAAEQQCILKEDLLKEMVQETLKEGDWDMSSLFENLYFANFCPRNSVQHFSCGKFVSTPVSNVL